MTVRVRLLGGFEVLLGEDPVPPEAWTRRQAAALVKLLTLAEGRRLHREQVIDVLWPGQPVDAAAPRLHKAAHYARRALGGDAQALVLRQDGVVLLPDEDVRVDVDEFRAAGHRALATGTAEAATSALEVYAGPLLPDDLYEPWTQEARESVQLLQRDLLRQAGRWEELVEVDPADEQAHLMLIRATAERDDVRGALRLFERMDRALRRELGTAPSAEARELRARLAAQAPVPGAPADAPSRGRLFGRRGVGDGIREALERAEAGRGGTLLLAGPPGVGKTAVLDLAEALARRRGWRTGRGTASAVEGPWPYAPVLEALGDLCRQHPALLDGLDDLFRAEIEQAMTGRDVPWSGESGHQRLFVAAAELVRLAAAGNGLVLLVDDLHDADEASLRLVHYLSRCAVTEPVLIVLTHRPLTGQPLQEVADSLVARGTGTRIDLPPLDQDATHRLLADRFPELPAGSAAHIWAVSAGLPFTVLELARQESAGGGAGGVVPALPDPVLRTFQRVALLGSTFTTDELLAVSGVAEEETYRHLGAALAGLMVQPAESGYRFRHALVREGLVARMAPHVESAARREVAETLVRLQAPAGRVAHQFLAAGQPSRAVPYVARAVETAGALGAYRDALSLVDGVRAHATPDQLPGLLARRGDLLVALGDTGAIAAYQEAVAVTTGTEHRLLRARLGRATAFAGDLDTAAAALAGLTLDGDVADRSILLARATLAYFVGDLDTAWEVVGEADKLLQSPDDPWQLMDMVSLQGLIAHQRGEWFERFRMELRRTRGKDRLATALFDAHLCVAEYVLYGEVPYPEVIADAEDLRHRAATAGALRGIAFATALIGEAALLMGDLERAEQELVEAVELHREIDASAGEAHSMQRLAEVRLAQGDRAGTLRLLDRALPLARWSVNSMHLLQRIYGTMIAASADPLAARAVVDRAVATLGELDRCSYCSVMLEVPSAIACAEVGDLDDARRHLAFAEESSALFEGSAWEAAVLEARAHLARAEEREGDFSALMADAGRLFERAGQPRDAARCVARGRSLPGLPEQARRQVTPARH